MSSAASASAAAAAALRETPLGEFHRRHGARMGAFAGYLMPLFYPRGAIAEHGGVREDVGFFDVSHMGQRRLRGESHERLADFLESLCPADVRGLSAGAARYSQLTNDEGGVIDDFIVSRPASGEEAALSLVVNASRKDVDDARLRAAMPSDVEMDVLDDDALLAIQGPSASRRLSEGCSAALESLSFMTTLETEIFGVRCRASRSGYTGEDGFEIAMSASDAEGFAERLASSGIPPVGLAARDTLRLEAGLCLYGNDLDEATSPVEAGLGWSIPSRRRLEGGFPGSERILRELSSSPSRIRIGALGDSARPIRAGGEVFLADSDSDSDSDSPIGRVSSGGYSPTLQRGAAMIFFGVPAPAAGTPIRLRVGEREMTAVTSSLPFVAHRYRR